MEKMMQPEIEAAAREILAYLDLHGDAPVLAVKDALGKPELYFSTASKVGCVLVNS